MRFIYLSSAFYKAYPASEYPELLMKQKRPYVQIQIIVDGTVFALPLRSHINHPHAQMTDPENRCGVDFTKAVVVTEDKYIDHRRTPQIRQKEFDALRGKEYRLKVRFRKYIETYKDAKKDPEDPVNQKILKYSSLKYFEEYLPD